jgi:hypothetical protein
MESSCSCQTSSKEWGEAEELPTMPDLFLEAYEAALRSNPQEYNIPLDGVHTLGQRSWRELKAMSWAAFVCQTMSSSNHPKVLHSSVSFPQVGKKQPLKKIKKWFYFSFFSSSNSFLEKSNFA